MDMALKNKHLHNTCHDKMVERKNLTIVEMIRRRLHVQSLNKPFWADQRRMRITNNINVQRESCLL